MPMEDIKNQVQGLLGGAPKTPAQELEDQICSLFPSLTYTQRLYGCLTCAAVGTLLR